MGTRIKDLTDDTTPVAGDAVPIDSGADGTRKTLLSVLAGLFASLLAGVGLESDGGSPAKLRVAGRVTGTGTWSDGAAHALITLPTSADKSYSVFANVVGRRLVAGAGGNETVGYIVHGVAENDNGALALVSTSSALSTREDTAACAAVIAVSGTNIEVQVVGVNLSTFDWVATVDYVVVG
jgi:hypothetical protein